MSNLSRAAILAEQIIYKCDNICLYEYLISIAPTFEEKEILSSILDTKRNHIRWLKDIFRCYIRCDCNCVCKCATIIFPIPYIDGIRRALLDELRSIEDYRRIRECLADRCQRDIMFRIITDALSNAIKLNYILNIHSLGLSTTPVTPELPTTPIIQ